MTEVWSCGGGTQSAAIAGLIVSGVLPKPDIALIVDTEREKATTWAYCDNILSPALASVGVDLVRVAKSDFATVDLLSSKEGKILLPGYTLINGKYTKQSGFCSNEWKKRVAQRYCRSVGVKECRNWLGISTDEMKRVRQSDKLWWQNYYPLVFGPMPMNREECIEFVTDVLGWPRPPRSACWMCPNMTKDEWDEVPEVEKRQAMELQESMQIIDPNFTLRPMNQQQLEAGKECEGMCFV